MSPFLLVVSVCRSQPFYAVDSMKPMTPALPREFRFISYRNTV
jgi:hypothetical protein